MQLIIWNFDRQSSIKSDGSLGFKTFGGHEATTHTNERA